MSVRAARRALFALAVCAAPLPLVVFADALAPPLRYAILAAAAAAVAFVEGGSGTVWLIVVVFALHAFVWTTLCWLVAWLAARSTAALSARGRTILVLAVCAVALGLALSMPAYRTPLGPAPRANLVGALS